MKDLGLYSGVPLWSLSCILKLDGFLPFRFIDHRLEGLVFSSIIISNSEDLPVGESLPVMKLPAKGINESLLGLVPSNEGYAGAMIKTAISIQFLDGK